VPCICQKYFKAVRPYCALCVDLRHTNLCFYQVLLVGRCLVVVTLSLEASVTWTRNYCKSPNSERFENLRIVQQVTTFPSLKEPEGSKLCSQEPATRPYPEQNNQVHILTLSSDVFIVIPITSGLFLWGFLTKILYTQFLCVSPAPH
jgi:hypothetical protein